MEEPFKTLVISLLGGFSGGIATHILQTMRLKKDRKTVILDNIFAEAEAMIDRCSVCSVEVWSARGGAKLAHQREVVGLIHDISTMVSFLTKKGVPTHLRIDSPYANFRRTLSGDQFDVKGRSAEPQRISEIRSSAFALKLALRDVRYEQTNSISFS